jgi:2-polyprenyl-6-methoxyphenol hydroxylase-like FAD-dependent oxidoreductase
MKILICGGGIAGLTLAGLLQQRGEHPVVIEKAATYSEGGYVLSLWSLGNRVLHGVSLYDRFLEVSVPLNHYTIANTRGRRLRSLPLREVFGEIRTLRRVDLLALLQSAANGIPIQFGTTVATLIQESDQVHVTLSDGTRSSYDLVVGADGIHSGVRRLLWGEIPLKETNWRVWWWWQSLPDWPEDEVQEWWGAQRFLGVYPIHQQVACAAVLPTTLTYPADPTTRVQTLQHSLRGYAGTWGAQILAHLDATALIDATLLADLDMPTWAYGRVVLIGDASAAFLPTAGIGASVAMESAAVLNDELSRVGPSQVPIAIDLFLKRRRQRIDALQHSSRWLARVMFPHARWLAWGRNQAVQVLSERQLLGDFATWLHRPI